MTRRQMLLKKIPQIEQGIKVRPPKEWWNGMRKIVGISDKYKGFPEARKDEITAGIWHGYAKEQQIKIIKELAYKRGGIPKPYKKKHNPNNPHRKIEIRTIL